jgi:hydroxymethylpyrimidine kinase / phosphomethylpyrimidine kinase / thiamine-phosphate diphosphorylase
MRPIDLRLYLVADMGFFQGTELVDAVMGAVAGGVTLVQLRGKKASRVALVENAKKLLSKLRAAGIPLVINDCVDTALEVGADGVHLGVNDESIEVARSKLGTTAIVGISVDTRTDLSALNLKSVDYVAASPVFHTTTKSNCAKPFGLRGLTALRSACELPIVAIGGMNCGNVEAALRLGADGIAVVSAILGRADVARAARELRNVIDASSDERFLSVVHPPRLLTIAGSDSGGGAGIQADLKTFEALGCYGMSSVTVLTAQNTCGVRAVFAAPSSFVVEQIESVVEDIGVDAVKLGMLFSVPIIQAVSKCLTKLNIRRVVVDPVMVAKGGSRLLNADATTALLEDLFPVANVITPNIPEAEVLTGMKIRSLADVSTAADLLLERCPLVVLKGGHSESESVSADYVASRTQKKWLEYERVHTPNLHGTGCTYSAAIAAYAAHGLDWFAAVEKARAYVQQAIVHGRNRKLGKGFGPLDHAWRMRRSSI